MILHHPTGLPKDRTHTRKSSTGTMTLHYGPDPYTVTPYEPSLVRIGAKWIGLEILFAFVVWLFCYWLVRK